MPDTAVSPSRSMTYWGRAGGQVVAESGRSHFHVIVRLIDVRKILEKFRLTLLSSC